MLNHPDILDRVIRPDCGSFPLELARQILTFDFPKPDHDRYAELSAKAGDGRLSADERGELEDYLNINDFLTIIKAKAQASLEHQSPAA